MKLQMMHWLRLLAVTLTLALPLGVKALAAGNTYTPETVPNVFAQDSLQLLTDPSDHIDEASQARINELLLQLRLSTGVEFAVVVLDDIEGDIESFSTQLFRLWGIGSKTRNDGLLLVLALDQRKMRFEVGYGLEGTLPDAVTSRIQRHEMVPLMKQGDYAGAIIAGIQAVQAQITGEGYTSDRRTARGGSRDAIPSTFLLFFYAVFIIATTYSAVSSLHGRIRQLQLDDGVLLTQLGDMRRTYSVYSVLMVILCPPVGILFWLYVRRTMSRLAHQALRCPKCKQETLHLLSPQATADRLTPSQLLEVRLHSMTYRACACTNCDYERIVGEEITGNKWMSCNRCGTRAASIVRQEHIRSPRGQRYIRTYYHCQYCGHDDHYDRKDDSGDRAALGALILSELLSSSGRRGGGGSGWGGGGGFSGGSFGGGSSGGGGSTSSW